MDRGEYSFNSEATRDALRDGTHQRHLREQALAGLRRKGLDPIADGSEGPDPGAVFDQLEGKKA